MSSLIRIRKVSSIFHLLNNFLEQIKTTAENPHETQIEVRIIDSKKSTSHFILTIAIPVQPELKKLPEILQTDPGQYFIKPEPIARTN